VREIPFVSRVRPAGESFDREDAQRPHPAFQRRPGTVRGELLQRRRILVDVATRKESGRIPGCSAPHVVKYGPLRERAFVTCKKITGIAIIEPGAKKLLKFHHLNVNPRSLTFSPDETKVYFGSFWINGFFEMETETGKITRLYAFDPPEDNRADQEVTYHGAEAVGTNIVLAANEGRSLRGRRERRDGSAPGSPAWNASPVLAPMERWSWWKSVPAAS